MGPPPARSGRRMGGGAWRPPASHLLTAFSMADSAVPFSLGPSAPASSTYRKAAGTNRSLFQVWTPRPWLESTLRARAACPVCPRGREGSEWRVAAPVPSGKNPAASRGCSGVFPCVGRAGDPSTRGQEQVVFSRLESWTTPPFGLLWGLVSEGMFITPAHYSDVVDERSIIKLCGYPLCQKKLGVIPKQKYRISTKTNKVYDITERKWASRPHTASSSRRADKGWSGCSGEVVQFFKDAITAADIDGPGACEGLSPSTCSECTSDDEQGFVSSLLPGDRPQAADTRPQPCKDSSTMKKKADQKVDSKHREQTVADVTERLGNCKLDSQEKACELPSKKEDAQISSPGPLYEGLHTLAVPDNRRSVPEVTLVGISKKSAEHFRTKFAKSNQGSKSASGPVQVCPEVAKANLLRVLKNTLTEWKTEETLTFLYGQDCASVCLKPSSAPVPDEELDEDDISCEAGSCGPAQSQPQNNLDDTLPVRGSDCLDFWVLFRLQ
ncbi:RNA polymerase II associated protein 2 [Cricetulus griseus]